MFLGMSYKEFWDEDVSLVKTYRKVAELRDKKRNQDLWMQGLYIYEALCDVAPILHAFAKKGTKPEPYAKEPYPITALEIRERKERDAREKEERFKAEFAAFAERMRNKMPQEAHPVIKGGETNVHND